MLRKQIIVTRPNNTVHQPISHITPIQEMMINDEQEMLKNKSRKVVVNNLCHSSVNVYCK